MAHCNELYPSEILGENKTKYYKNQRIDYIAFSSSCYLLINEVILAHKISRMGR